MSWAEEVRGYPAGAFVRSLVGDGVFVQVGTIGRISGREYIETNGERNLYLMVTWLDTDTRTTVACETVERIEDAA